MADGGCDLGFFAINLDRSPERWAGIEAGFASLPWPLHRVSALDARSDPDGVLAKRGLAATTSPDVAGWNHLRARPHSLVEEACFASHMAALEMFLDSGHAHGVILEDDAVPVTDLTALLPGICAQGGFDVVKLEGIARKGGRPAFMAGRVGGHMLVRSLRPSSGSAAYLVTRAAAAALIAKAGTRTIPYDDFLSNPGLHRLAILHVAPFAVRQAGEDSTMSTIRAPAGQGKKRDPWNYVSLRVARGSLRVALWLHAVRGVISAPGRLVFAPWGDPAGAA